jgi:hypothetical protein
VNTGKLSFQRFDVAFTSLGITCQSDQNPHRRCALNPTQFGAGAGRPDKIQLQRPNSLRISL